MTYAFGSFSQFMNAHTWLRPIVLAVSGGPDSIAMMHMAALWREEAAQKPIFHIATIHHCLRQQAGAEAEYVAREAKTLSFDHITLYWGGEKPDKGLQEAARNARYDLLETYAQSIKASHLFTAHTRDDQAETVLMRLSCGSGLSGLGAMRIKTQRAGGLVHMRPLLDVTKRDLVALCRERGWNFYEDPSNQNPDFTRVRWRALMPFLEQEGLTAARLGLLAQRAQRGHDALEAITTSALQRAFISPHLYKAELFANQPFEIALRMVWHVCMELKPELDAQAMRLEKLERLTADLLAALQAQKPLTRTLAGVLLRLNSKGQLSLKPEPPRSRGRANLDPKKTD
jgi:tRNA(Ile)-lysidine synthase